MELIKCHDCGITSTLGEIPKNHIIAGTWVGVKPSHVEYYFCCRPQVDYRGNFGRFVNGMLEIYGKLKTLIPCDMLPEDREGSGITNRFQEDEHGDFWVVWATGRRKTTQEEQKAIM